MVLAKFITVWSGVASLQVYGARVKRSQSAGNVGAKFIAGVPVLNYHLAYAGASSATLTEDMQEHWVVSVKSGASDSEIAEMCMTSKGCESSGHPDEGGVPFLAFHGTESDLENFLSTTADKVEFIEPDMPMSIPDDEDDAPDDDEVHAAAATWGLNRIGADDRSRDGSGSHIYILDTGVRVTHTQFGGRAVPAIDVMSGSLQECSQTSTTCAADRRGHGTHCAGSAAGSTMGVAPGARVYGAKVLSDRGSGSTRGILSAVDWVASKGSRPAVVSMSLGGSGVSSAYKRAIDAAVSAGVTVVLASGNSNSDACNFSPAYVASAITVGSTDSNDRRSYFSNFGSCVQIWGPGSRIVSAGHEGDSQTATKSGTSMACPHVAGGAALALQASPSSSPSSVLQKMLDVAESGKISDLKSGDVNKLLNVRGQ